MERKELRLDPAVYDALLVALAKTGNAIPVDGQGRYLINGMAMVREQTVSFGGGK